MMWEERPLNELCRIGDGAHASLKRIDKGILYLTAKNVTVKGLDLSKVDYISEETFEKHFKRKSTALTLPEKDDIIYSIIGSIGGCYLINNEKIGVSSSIAIFRPNKEIITPQFLCYYIKSRAFAENVNAVKGGVAQGFMSLSKLGLVKIRYPQSIETQKRIADILSAYDDLIENNQKQIKLLEEMAQRLYKEWFVDLRFPNCENTEIIDGVPNGWKKCCLSDILDIKYGKDHKVVSDGEIPVYGSGGFMRKGNKSLYSGEAVLIPRKGSLNNIMYVNEAFWTVDTMFYTKMKKKHVALYVYFFMQRFDMYGMNIGAAVPSMTTNILNSLDIVVSNEELLKKFDGIVLCNYKKIASLKHEMDLLQQARDRLLPKLMSGELEV